MIADILIYAVIAALLLYRLHAVLGTNAEQQQPRPTPRTPAPPADSRPAPPPVPLEGLRPLSDQQGAIADGVRRLRALDPSFDETRFLRGAEIAFTMIIRAFSSGDRAVLESLLTPDLRRVFLSALESRERDGHVLQQEVRRIALVDLVSAEVLPDQARLEVRLISEQTMVLRDREGAVLEGSADLVQNVTDLWTFVRDPRASDPTWFLARTRSPEA